MWAVVLTIGLPAARLNPTAVALVVAKLFGWAIYRITGDNLPVEYYAFPDIFVIAMIMAKEEHCNRMPYRSTWHQLKCLLLERSPGDRAVLLAFPLMWCLYAANLHPYYKWWALYYLVLAQFLAVGAETFINLSRASKAASDASDKPPSGGLYRLAWGRGYG